MIDLLSVLVDSWRQTRQWYGGRPNRDAVSRHRGSGLAPLVSSLGSGADEFLQNLAARRQILRFVAG
ncbi:hypothetical protein, partial [Thioalkalivibrio sp.]|uniref:hypothetical protein n=1 Tax=Thioalkalivibrio sp. TaxID=2093813 RepID=UPI0025F82277